MKYRKPIIKESDLAARLQEAKKEMAFKAVLPPKSARAPQGHKNSKDKLALFTEAMENPEDWFVVRSAPSLDAARQYASRIFHGKSQQVLKILPAGTQGQWESLFDTEPNKDGNFTIYARYMPDGQA